LEEGKITSSEAIELMSQLNEKGSNDQEQRDSRGKENSEDTDKSKLNDYFDQFTDEFNKYVNKDKESSSYSNDTAKSGRHRQVKQIFDGHDNAFDTVGCSHDPLGARGPSNRLIGTREQDVSSNA